MINFIVHTNNILYIRKGWLSDNIYHCVSKDTIKDWYSRKINSTININGYAYISYTTIPAPTRNKLPNIESLQLMYKIEHESSESDLYYNALKNAQNNFPQFIDIYKADERNFTLEKVTQYAKHHAVWDAILNLHKPQQARQIIYLSDAYNRLIRPDKPYKGNRFQQQLGVAKRDGIKCIVCRKDDSAYNTRNTKYSSTHKAYVLGILSSGKAYNIPQSLKKLNEMCEDGGLETPGITWLKKIKSQNENLIKESRYGSAVYNRENNPYANIEPAKNPGSQWQVDGWRLPLYGRERDEKTGTLKLSTYILFAVMDAHSRKIVGYSIDKSENTQMILKALERATQNTGYLPFEVVSDKHAFHRTEEAKSLKEVMERLNIKFTVDTNPQRKSIVERFFKRLAGNNFKDKYGYVGQGIKTKERDGRTSQELIDYYTKPENLLTADEIKAETFKAILEYNNTGLEKFNGQTPNERYQATEITKAIPVSEAERIQLFTPKTAVMVHRQQITIKRSGITYDYQLPAGYMNALNGKKVAVRYLDLSEIYVFDYNTDRFICTLKQKPVIHGALADQTEKDIELLNKNAGRIKGLKAQTRKAKERLTAEALKQCPESFEILNKVLTPKSIYQEVQTNFELRSMLLEDGINPDNLPIRTHKSELTDAALMPKNKEKESPFAVKNHKIKTYIPSFDYDE
jgi:transposase InsO family protein